MSHSYLAGLRAAQQICAQISEKGGYADECLEAINSLLASEYVQPVKLKGCPDCFGSGGKRVNGVGQCPFCNGTGKVPK